MNNALATTQTALDKLHRSLGKSSLDALVQARTRRSLLLVDCSSSMNGYILAGGRKIDALRKVVQNLEATHPVPVVAFNSRAIQVVEDIPAPAGGTPLDQAIRFAAVQEANHIVLVSDGEPNNEAAAFEAAREFGGPIDVFYIGNGHDRGARFSAELAKMTGGTCGLTDLGEPKQLSSKIAGLLGDGADTI